LGLLAVVAFVGLACLQPLDRTPFLSARYHQETLRRWEGARGGVIATNGAVKAGWERVRMTPTVSEEDDAERGRFRAVPLAGYGARKGRPMEQGGEDVWAKALALQVGDRRVVFVALDALIVPWEVADAACRDLAGNPGLRREEVYLGATHTHSSLGGWGDGFVAEQFAGPFNPGIRSWMRRCIVEAARGAVGKLSAASVGTGSFGAPEWVRNRLVGDAGRVDDVFSLLAARKPDGSMAVLGAFGAHATLLGADTMRMDRDYPGTWGAMVEKATGGMALFMAGAVGSQSASGARGHGRERVRALGEGMGARTMATMGSMTFHERVDLGAVGVKLALPSLHLRVTEGLRLRPWVARPWVPVRPETFVQSVRVGDMVWVSMPCDFSGELSVRMREELAGHGRRLAVTSFNGDYVGYVIPGRYHHLGGYEPRVMSFHGPTTGDYFEDWGRRMMLAW
jgi:hypothetical protein